MLKTLIKEVCPNIGVTFKGLSQGPLLKEGKFVCRGERLPTSVTARVDSRIPPTPDLISKVEVRAPP